MFEKFLLTNFGARKENYVESINKLKAELNNIISAIQEIEKTEKEGGLIQVAAKQKLDWALKRFPFDELEVLKGSSYIRKQSLFKDVVLETGQHFETLSKNLNSAEDRLNVSTNPFIAIDNNLSLLRKRVQSYFSRAKLGVQGLFLFPLLLSAGLNLYYRFGRGFESLSSDIINPALVYSPEKTRDGTFLFTEDYKKEYWEELSKMFFLEPNTFSSQFLSNHNLLSKFVLKSKHATKPTLIYDISMEVGFEAMEVDWNNLIVDSKLQITDDGRSLILDNRVGPPSKEIKYSIRNQDDVLLSEGMIEKLLFNSHSIDLAFIKDENHHVYFEYNQYPYIQMYAKIDSKPILPEGYYLEENKIENPYSDEEFVLQSSIYDRDSLEKFFDFDGQWYEIVRNSDELSQHIELFKIINVKTQLQFKDLNDKTYAKEHNFSLTDPIVYYEKSEKIILERPRYYPMDSEGDGMISLLNSELFSSAYTEFIENLVGPPPYIKDPKGINMMVDTFHIVLNQKGVGSSSKNLDAILNPLGYVIGYADIENVNMNGMYHISFVVNNKEREKIRFENWIPSIVGANPVSLTPAYVSYSNIPYSQGDIDDIWVNGLDYIEGSILPEIPQDRYEILERVFGISR